jgi:geranylgeranyl diphosphate synthase type I
MLTYQLGYTDESGAAVPAPAGKRFRPILCLLGCEAVGGDWDRALCCSAAIELLHNFSLIHDDIEDHDPERRHRPTVWKVWGEPQAVNAGDAMFALAFEAAIDACDEPELGVMLARRFEQTARSLTHGQYLDMSFETRQDVTPAECMEMIDLKTGALIEFSVWSGALLGGASLDTAETMAEFGAELGRAFQIRDDIMGIWAGSEVTGKERGKDVRNRKKTLPVLLARQTAAGPAAEILEGFYAGAHDSADRVIEALSEIGARQRSIEEVRHHLRAALGALERAHLHVPGARQLADLSAELTG